GRPRPFMTANRPERNARQAKKAVTTLSTRAPLSSTTSTDFLSALSVPRIAGRLRWIARGRTEAAARRSALLSCRRLRTDHADLGDVAPLREPRRNRGQVTAVAARDCVHRLGRAQRGGDH